MAWRKNSKKSKVAQERGVTAKAFEEASCELRGCMEEIKCKLDKVLYKLDEDPPKESTEKEE